MELRPAYVSSSIKDLRSCVAIHCLYKASSRSRKGPSQSGFSSAGNTGAYLHHIALVEGGTAKIFLKAFSFALPENANLFFFFTTPFPVALGLKGWKV